MSPQDLKKAFFETLRAIAPEIDPAAIDPSSDLREAFDLDSMDFLRLVAALEQSLGVSVAEADYVSFRTMNSALDFLGRRKRVTGE